MFREAQPGDVPVLLAMIREFYAFERIAFDEPAARTALSQLLGNPSFGRVWIADDAGEAVGYVVLTLGFSLEFKGRDAFIDEIFFRENHRGRGLGRQAIELAVQTCGALGVRALHLEAVREHDAAVEFYRRNGFVDHDRYLLTRWITP